MIKDHPQTFFSSHPSPFLVPVTRECHKESDGHIEHDHVSHRSSQGSYGGAPSIFLPTGSTRSGMEDHPKKTSRFRVDGRIAVQRSTTRRGHQAGMEETPCPGGHLRLNQSRRINEQELTVRSLKEDHRARERGSLNVLLTLGCRTLLIRDKKNLLNSNCGDRITA